ncbi:ABC transporter substrate-binding protein [Methylobacterium sp. J-072]|uniref:ABC transporter substrate-binding protein n=1 Tax=Methylobacterium sp. J-072 TaxID=2836651 RepID=UPI001FBB9A7A|nr:ABC transporter substrate-binding protein [Methylobacterium sp. J-072]MCJ2091146.1 ABC transporter substrate-binding protein [Methylobacterium sp. J-072]
MIAARSSWRVIRTALLASLALAFPSLARAEPLTIRIGFASIGVDNRPFAGGDTLAVAHAEGYVQRALQADPDVKVEWSFFKGAGPAVNEAIANGQLDFALQGDLPSIIGRASGLKTKILAATGAHAPTYLAVADGSSIKGVTDLRGRKVSIFRGTNNHLAVVKILAANGLTERDLQVLNMDTATTNAALASRDIEAAFGNFPLISLAEQKKAAIVYATKGNDRGLERQSALLVTEAFERAHPDLVAKVVKALVEAARWSSDEANRDALIAVWAKSGTPASVFRYDLADQELRYRNSPLVDPFFVEQYRVQARQAKAFGLIRRDVDVTGWFEPHYVDQAVRELGLERYWERFGPDGKPLGS